MDISDKVIGFFISHGYYDSEKGLKTIINNKKEDILDMEYLFEIFLEILTLRTVWVLILKNIFIIVYSQVKF